MRDVLDMQPQGTQGTETAQSTQAMDAPLTCRTPRNECAKPKGHVFGWLCPLLFYVATWGSTTLIGAGYSNGGFWSGLWFSVPLMVILTCHEMGHYLQTRRYGVRSSWPFFIPIPFPPFGTLGAIISMDCSIPSTRVLFDIGITGPLAGLVPTLVFLVLGMSLSFVGEVQLGENSLVFGEPLIFRWVASLFFDLGKPGTDIVLHPIGMAAWTGLFLTSLNLFPLGQLDGGHVLYALLKRRAIWIARLLMVGIGLYICMGHWQWIVMFILVAWLGIGHPPTRKDYVPLGTLRTVLGWLALLFVIIGFTPNPVSIPDPPVRKPLYAQTMEQVPTVVAAESVNCDQCPNLAQERVPWLR